MKNFSQNHGFMMVEILVAVSIITASMLAALTVAQHSIQVSREALHVTQAGFLLEEGAEAVRVARDNAWSKISDLVAGVQYYPKFSDATWVLSSTTAADGVYGVFSRYITVAAVNRDTTTKDISTIGTNDPRTKLVTVTVSWMEGAMTITKTLQFYIINIFS